MKFVDEADILVSGGHGGPGCVSFRREKYVPRGGPNGGDGGRGGHVMFVADSRLGTLADFRYKRIYKAQNGQPGSSGLKTGPDGQDIVVRVPLGTTIRLQTESEDGQGFDTVSSIDLIEEGQSWMACKGGRGGKGNTHFASPTFQAPKFAQPGEEGETKRFKLELKLLADVGIVGQPNAGKSTLISVLSRARPKIADYPFTTLSPVLGVVQINNDQSIVMADIPGLIRGAHKGVGLGHRFLKHVERTRAQLFLLDPTPALENVLWDNSESVERAAIEIFNQLQTLKKELELFHEDLVKKPVIVAINKIDLIPPQCRKEFEFAFESVMAKEETLPVLEVRFISAVSQDGLQEIRNSVSRIFDERFGQEETPVVLPDSLPRMPPKHDAEKPASLAEDMRN